MKRYLAVDSGGTKVLCIVYDEEFRPLAACKIGSLRTKTTTQELIDQHMQKLIRTLGFSKEHKTHIDGVFGIIHDRFIEYLEPYCTFGEIHRMGELPAGLGAAEIVGNGFLALSGTGSTVFAKYDTQYHAQGGYGAAVFDEGSGYTMGRNAVKAALADYNGYGPHTLMTQMLADKFNQPAEDLPFAIHGIINQPEMSPVTSVAACAPLVSEAAEQGDAEALRILEESGLIMGAQLNKLAERYNIPKNLPVAISGSAWKSHRKFLDTFVKVIREKGFTGKLVIPSFEPIVGIIISHYCQIYKKFDAQDHEKFLRLYEKYIFKIN